MEQEMKDIMQIFRDVLEQEENSYKEKGTSFAYSANKATFIQHIVEAIEEKYPNIKVDTEHIRTIATLEMNYAYCEAERRRFYKRESYESEEAMQEKISNIREQLDKEKEKAIANIIQANGISIDSFDEKKFEALWQNGFKGGFTSPVLDFAYRNYCQNKEKEQAIEGLEKTVSTLEEKNTRQEKVIKGDDEAIKTLAKSNEQLQGTLKKQRVAVTHLVDRLDTAEYEMTELNSKIQNEKKKSLFARLVERVKGFFNKAPRLTGVESSYKSVSKQVSEAMEILNESGASLNETINAHEGQSASVEQMLVKRERLKNGQTAELEDSRTTSEIDIEK